jgi:hypothetical protein
VMLPPAVCVDGRRRRFTSARREHRVRTMQLSSLLHFLQFLTRHVRARRPKNGDTLQGCAPTEPLRKSKLARDWRSTRVWKCTRNARIVCLYGSLTPDHSKWSPSRMLYHSILAASPSCVDSRCPSRALTARASSLYSSARRRQRERMSPTAGPPRTRTISAVLPPSSDTGSTCETADGAHSSLTSLYGTPRGTAGACG